MSKRNSGCLVWLLVFLCHPFFIGGPICDFLVAPKEPTKKYVAFAWLTGFSIEVGFLSLIVYLLLGV